MEQTQTVEQTSTKENMVFPCSALNWVDGKWEPCDKVATKETLWLGSVCQQIMSKYHCNFHATMVKLVHLPHEGQGCVLNNIAAIALED